MESKVYKYMDWPEIEAVVYEPFVVEVPVD